MFFEWKQILHYFWDNSRTFCVALSCAVLYLCAWYITTVTIRKNAGAEKRREKEEKMFCLERYDALPWNTIVVCERRITVMTIRNRRSSLEWYRYFLKNLLQLIMETCVFLLFWERCWSWANSSTFLWWLGRLAILVLKSALGMLYIHALLLRLLEFGTARTALIQKRTKLVYWITFLLYSSLQRVQNRVTVIYLSVWKDCLPYNMVVNISYSLPIESITHRQGW